MLSGNGIFRSVRSAAAVALILATGLCRPATVCADVQDSPHRHILARGDQNYPPYEFIDDEGNAAGFNVDLVRAVGRVMGLEIDVRLGPWDEVRKDLESGRIDLITGMCRTPERDRILDFSTPHSAVSYAMFVRKGAEVRNLEDVATGEIIVQRGDVMHDYAREHLPEAKLVLVENHIDALRQLAAGQHDCALLGKMQGLYFIRKYQLVNLEPVGPPLQSFEYCFAVKDGDAVLLGQIDEGMAILKRTGEYDRIREKWFGVLESPPFMRALLRWIAVGLTALVVLLVLVVWWNRSLRRRVAARTAELTRELAERRRLEEQLRQSQKMEALGQLAGGIAHDFNNLLTGILGYAELLRLGRHDADRDVLLDGILKTGRRAVALTAQLLTFSRRQNIQTVACDMHRLVHNVVELLEHTIDRRIDVRMELDAARATVSGDPAQLENALLNLGVNARDAMPAGGTLIFRTSVVEVDKPRTLSTHLTLVPAEYLLVEVIDTGLGIDDTDLAHVFEPFFTTKEEGRGTGLGLAAVYGTVKAHGGAVGVETERGKGTTFRIWLPLATESEQVSAADRRRFPDDGRGTVLLVDDEEAVREVTRRMLERMGCRVLEAADGREGLERFTEHHEEIGLVILDLMIPRMNGQELLKHIRETDTEVPVIVISAFDPAEKALELETAGVSSIIRKPFDMGELAERVTAALAQRVHGKN